MEWGIEKWRVLVGWKYSRKGRTPRKPPKNLLCPTQLTHWRHRDSNSGIHWGRTSGLATHTVHRHNLFILNIVSLVITHISEVLFPLLTLFALSNNVKYRIRLRRILLVADDYVWVTCKVGTSISGTNYLMDIEKSF